MTLASGVRLGPYEFLGLSRRQYDVSADGQRFLASARLGEQGPVPITLVQNWTAKALR